MIDAFLDFGHLISTFNLIFIFRMTCTMLHEFTTKIVNMSPNCVVLHC